MAKIARLQLSDGSVRYARYRGDGTFELIEGDVFDEWLPTGQVVSGDQVRLLAPVSPPNIIAIGLNYRRHAQESGMALPEWPVIFLKATTAVCGPEDSIVLPKIAPNEVDYECELAIIIGKKYMVVLFQPYLL